MNKFFLYCLVVVLFGFYTLAQESSPSGSQIYIKMGEAQTKKSLLALPPFQFHGSPGVANNHQAIGNELYRVVQNDLSISNYFQFIKHESFLEDPAKTALKPHPSDANGFKFEKWSAIGAEFLIRGGFTIAGSELVFEVYVYHVPRANLVMGKKYRGPSNATRKLAHTFSNDLLEALTGKKGMFLSRIVVASDKGGKDIKEIYVMDWDGAQQTKITNHRSIALSPAWSPDGTKVAYTASVQRSRTKTRNWDMFMYEMPTGRRWLLSYRLGLNSGANFSPDGKFLFLTITQQGNPDIYRMNIDGSLDGKITNGPAGALNVEPAVSPDGKQIAFSSDRSGQPMIYVMNVDGSNPKRITFAGKYNATPSWSPDGKKIAFAGWEDDHFDVFIMNADGTDMVRITSAKKPNGKWSMNEDPVFSPDGRHLMYTSNRTGTNQIFISNLDGSDERRITTDNANYFRPKWSVNVE